MQPVQACDVVCSSFSIGSQQKADSFQQTTTVSPTEHARPELCETLRGLSFCCSDFDLCCNASQAFVILEKEIEDSLPQFQELILTLKSVDFFFGPCSRDDNSLVTNRSLPRRPRLRESGYSRLSRSTMHSQSGYGTFRRLMDTGARRSACRSP